MSSKKLMTWEAFDLDSSRRFYTRCIAEVVLFPKANGERLFMRWHGAEDRFVVPPVPRLTSPVPAA
jgi:hypothetical protein